MIWLIAGLGLVALGVLLFFALQMPEKFEKKRKKKRAPLPEPPKDWQAIAERQEKRLRSLEQSLGVSADELKGRDRKIEDLNRAALELKRQFEQEQAWREKGEALVANEKKQERILQEELDKSRTDLNEEATRRIKQEYELKELRQIREELTLQVRALSANKLQLERTLAEATIENKRFRLENAELKKKKEGEQWIARADYKRLEGFLKRARWEVEQFKKVVPMAQWPRALQPKPDMKRAPEEANAGSSAGLAAKPPDVAGTSVDSEVPREDPQKDSSLQGV